MIELDDHIVRIVHLFNKITCRGVFYQAVVGWLVEKTEANVNLIERRLLKLRREGRVPYDKIVDESRIVYGFTRYGGLADLAEDAAQLYRRDYWTHSDVAVQVWVEKRGMAGLLQPVVCGKWGLNLYVAVGQMSESYLYVAGREIARHGKPTYVYAMTDFDAAGEIIFRTLRDGSKNAPGGLKRFTDGVPVHVEKIALNHDQVKTWNLPTRPGKKTDKRSAEFVKQYGDIATELDAMTPDQVLGLVNDAVSRHMPTSDLRRLKHVEATERETVRDLLSGLMRGDEDESAN